MEKIIRERAEKFAEDYEGSPHRHFAEECYEAGATEQAEMDAQILRIALEKAVIKTGLEVKKNMVDKAWKWIKNTFSFTKVVAGVDVLELEEVFRKAMDEKL